MSSCWDNSAKELSTVLARQRPDRASYTGPFRGPQAQTLEEQSAMLLCRMWRMTGMLDAIMDPDNIVHLRAWLEVSGFSPSMDAIGGKDLTRLSFHSSGITAEVCHCIKTCILQDNLPLAFRINQWSIMQTSTETLSTRAHAHRHTCTKWAVWSRMSHPKPTAVRGVYEMKEEIKKCLRSWMHQLCYSNFLSVWCVQVLTRQLILSQIFSFIYFSVPVMDSEKVVLSSLCR